MDFGNKKLQLNSILAFCKKYYKLILILIIYVGFSIITFGKYGHILYDSFREAILPEAVLDGKILYKDILILYPPLAYYLNACLFKIFGSNLSVLYIAGILNSVIVLASIYVIIKQLSNSTNALLSVFVIMFLFTFRIEIFNSSGWFFPYSYALIYAFSSIFVAFAFFVLYLTKQKNIYLYLTSFFTGLSIAFKLDYVSFIIVIFFTLLSLRSKHLFIKNLIILIFPIVVSYLIYLYTGGSFEIILKWFQFLNNFANLDIIKNYNNKFLATAFNSIILCDIKEASFSFFLYTGIIFFTVFTFIINLKIKNNKIIPICIIILYLLFFLKYSPGMIINKFLFDNLCLHSNFIFLPYLVLFLTLCIVLFKKKYSIQDRYFLLLFMIAFCLSIRDYMSLYVTNIGNFTAVTYFLCLIYFLLDVLPQYLPEEIRNIFKKSISVTLILLSLSYGYIYIERGKLLNTKLEYPKGTIYIFGEVKEPIIEALDFAEKHIKNGKSLVTFSEGCIINYFLNIPTDLYYYSLNSHLIDAFGEDNVEKYLKDKQPDYIYIISEPIYLYAHGIFGKTFGFKINEYIQNNYKLVRSVNEGEDSLISLKIYEK